MLALLIRLDVQANKEDDVEALLRSVESVAGASPSAARCWFALRMAPAIYGLFSIFNDDSERDAYLSSLDRMWAERTSELLSRPPVIEKIEILAGKPSAFSEGAPSKVSSSAAEKGREAPIPTGPAEIPKVGSRDAPGG